MDPDFATEAAQAAGIDSLTREIAELPDVDWLEASRHNGAPEVSWGDRFFFVGGNLKQPFATIVQRNIPGWDEESELDRLGVFRLNLDLGREEFERQFGYPPAALSEHRASLDFAALDVLMPHPAYGRQGWASILNPGRQRPEVNRLIRHAYEKALRRDRRHLREPEDAERRLGSD
jgi:Family of unknown function (DUF6194)